MENKKTKPKDIAATYNKYKFFQGKQYTGMAIGRSHKWYYDKGVWIDKKITPEKWLINYAVTKRRAGKAPEGSGAAVGTEYHWYILAHQMVKKLDANSYSTELNGLKFKLAHKRSSKNTWSASDKAQKNLLIKILKGFIAELEEETPEEFAYDHGNVIEAMKKEKKKSPAKVLSEMRSPAKKVPVKKKPVKKKLQKEGLTL
jgi:hypothetical protein